LEAYDTGPKGPFFVSAGGSLARHARSCTIDEVFFSGSGTMADKKKVDADRDPLPGADRDRKSEPGPDARRGNPAPHGNHAVATPSPDDRRGGQGQDARVSRRDQRQGRRTKEATRESGESGYANNDNVPDAD